MKILKSKIRSRDGSVVTTIPGEAAHRLGISPGDDLYWLVDDEGGYRVCRVSPERLEMLKAHDAAIAEYGDVFSALAK